MAAVQVVRHELAALARGVGRRSETRQRGRLHLDRCRRGAARQAVVDGHTGASGGVSGRQVMGAPFSAYCGRARRNYPEVFSPQVTLQRLKRSSHVAFHFSA